MISSGRKTRLGCKRRRRRFVKCDCPSSRVLVPPGRCRSAVTKMYQLCLLEPALFRFLHDAPRSELLIDLPLNFFMTLRGHLASEGEYYRRAEQQGSAGSDKSHPGLCHWRVIYGSSNSNSFFFWGYLVNRFSLKPANK